MLELNELRRKGYPVATGVYRRLTISASNALRWTLSTTMLAFTSGEDDEIKILKAESNCQSRRSNCGTDLLQVGNVPEREPERWCNDQNCLDGSLIGSMLDATST